LVFLSPIRPIPAQHCNNPAIPPSSSFPNLQSFRYSIVCSPKYGRLHQVIHKYIDTVQHCDTEGASQISVIVEECWGMWE
jgi:hypothetical protein